MKTDRSGRNLEEYRQLFWDEQKRVKELDGFITEYQKRELNFLERIAALVDELGKANNNTMAAQQCADDFKFGYERNQAKIAELEATIKRVKAEVRNIDETFSHPYTTSREAYQNIRSIVECLHKALGEAK